LAGLRPTGDQSPVEASEGVLAFRRDGLLVAVNFTDEARPFAHAGELVISSDPDRTQTSASLNPSEALIVRTS
jgi:hypothetical protein